VLFLTFSHGILLPISGIANNLQDGVVGIQQTIENNVPYGKFGLASTHAAIGTGVSTANNIGELASAPGAAMVMMGTVPSRFIWCRTIYHTRRFWTSSGSCCERYSYNGSTNGQGYQ